VLFKDSRQNLWVGTFNGLNKFDPGLGQFQRFLSNKQDSTSLSDNEILCINEDSFQNLWVGTNHGLNLMNREKGTFKVYTTKNGLPDNSINAIYPDQEGNLWLSTHNGISKFNPKTKEVRNFNKSDGISSNELAPFAHCKTSDGEILLGSNNGLTLFNPDQIRDNEIKPKVVLTNFKLCNKNVKLNGSDSPLKRHISQCDEITLTYKQTFVIFEYVALNYSSPEKNQYAYMLEGFEDEWNYVGNKREATYTNLDAGTYTFRVKASNNDGLWNEEGVALKITVLPPPWLSWWAYGFYLVLFVFLILVFRNYNIRRAKAEKEHEQDKENLRFFINVSHEFRTPLTLILSPVQKLLQSNSIEESKHAAKCIQASTNKLLNLVNQLLDFRKTDLGLLPLRAAQVDIVSFIKEIVKSFEYLGQSKNIRLQFDSSVDALDVWFDPDKLEKIINNLLSNAIKYTDEGGKITISISKVTHSRNNSNGVEIRVQDTGIGLNPQQQKHIFERFYKSDENRTGTGIGLNFTKSLVELHGGEISVESTLGEGSTFTVFLRLGKEHLKTAQLCEGDFKMSDFKFDEDLHESVKYDIETADDAIDDGSELKSYSGNQIPMVLLVEDNAKLRSQMREELKGLYHIKEAGNGEDGLNMAVKYFPDVIISDIMMPKMNGIELCRKIKSDLYTCHIPVVLLTAKTLVENKIEGFKSGADEYISKPFQMEVLVVRIQNILEERRRLKEKFKTSGALVPSSELTNNNMDEVFLEKATKIVFDNISDPDFVLADLLKEMGMSRSSFYLKINSLTGTSPTAFIRTIKLKYAAELLVTQKYRINEICTMAGFNHQTYFNKTFRDFYGMSPLQYLKKNGKE
jgi:signal transduction histidine kinase/CheY-like chemotaxis protein/AraC-like DNA-binding protein